MLNCRDWYGFRRYISIWVSKLRCRISLYMLRFFIIKMWSTFLLVSLLCSQQRDFSIKRQVIHRWDFALRLSQLLFNLGVVSFVLIYSNDVLSFWQQEWVGSSFLALMIITCALIKNEVHLIKTLFACKSIWRIFVRFVMIVWVDKMTHQMVRL